MFTERVLEGCLLLQVGVMFDEDITYHSNSSHNTRDDQLVGFTTVLQSSEGFSKYYT